MCKFYPCHEECIDCSFCFCPFYPCGLSENGTGKSRQDVFGLGKLSRTVIDEAVFEMGNGNERVFSLGNVVEWDIWDCTGCSLAHNRKFVKAVSKGFDTNEWKVLWKG